jgi:hypothetical protein
VAALAEQVSAVAFSPSAGQPNQASPSLHPISAQQRGSLEV